MINFYLFLLLSGLTIQNLQIISPPNLMYKFNKDGQDGSIDYTASTFGDILYTEKATV